MDKTETGKHLHKRRKKGIHSNFYRRKGDESRRQTASRARRASQVIAQSPLREVQNEPSMLTTSCEGMHPHCAFENLKQEVADSCMPDEWTVFLRQLLN